MIKLLLLFIILLATWQLLKMLSREATATIEEARTIGLQEASAHINNPILLMDYSSARGIPKETLAALIEAGDLLSYCWRQYTYIENRELVVVNK